MSFFTTGFRFTQRIMELKLRSTHSCKRVMLTTSNKCADASRNSRNLSVILNLVIGPKNTASPNQSVRLRFDSGKPFYGHLLEIKALARRRFHLSIGDLRSSIVCIVCIRAQMDECDGAAGDMVGAHPI